MTGGTETHYVPVFLSAVLHYYLGLGCVVHWVGAYCHYYPRLVHWESAYCCDLIAAGVDQKNVTDAGFDQMDEQLVMVHLDVGVVHYDVDQLLEVVHHNAGVNRYDEVHHDVDQEGT